MLVKAQLLQTMTWLDNSIADDQKISDLNPNAPCKVPNFFRRKNFKVRTRYNISNFPALFSALAVAQIGGPTSAKKVSGYEKKGCPRWESNPGPLVYRFIYVN